MESKSYLVWVALYTEFATKLLDYANDRNALIAKLQMVYKGIGLKFPKVDSSEAVADIDPFTIFGFFNKGITKANRIAILKGIAKEFSIKAPVPTTFDGIPVLNNLNATFYKFVGDPDRGEHDIDNLWSVFSAALAYADDSSSTNRESFITAFDVVKDLKGNRWKLTMGLYWVRPMQYVNLDSRNRWFIENPDNMPVDCIAMIKGLNTVPAGADYLDICEAFTKTLSNGKYGYKNLPELSHYAWEISEQVNQEKRETDKPIKRGNTGAAIADENVDGVHYWLYSPGYGADKWDEFYQKNIMAIEWGAIGDLSAFSTKDEMKRKMKECYGADLSYIQSAHATWQFAHEMKPGDVVFAKKGKFKIIGRGIVSSDYYFQAGNQDDYNNFRKIKWTEKGEWEHTGHAVAKVLTDITVYTEYVKKLNALFETDVTDSAEEKAMTYPPYSSGDFLDEVYMMRANTTIWLRSC